MKYSVAPRAARYQVVNDDPKVQARLEALGLDKFTALSIGTESGQLCIVPLDESSRENAEFIVRACNAYPDLVAKVEEGKRLLLDEMRRCTERTELAIKLRDANADLVKALQEMVDIAQKVDGWESFPFDPIEKAEAALAKAGST